MRSANPRHAEVALARGALVHVEDNGQRANTELHDPRFVVITRLYREPLILVSFGALHNVDEVPFAREPDADAVAPASKPLYWINRLISPAAAYCPPPATTLT